MSDLDAKPVYYFARMVPGYRVPVLERLNRRLGGRLVACSGQPPGQSSLRSITTNEETGYRQVPLRNVWIRGETLHAQPYGRAFAAFGNPAVVLVEESPRSVTLPLLLARARRLGAGRVLWGHFSSNRRDLSPGHPLDRYRLHLARSVEACVAYTDAIADALRPYVSAERLFVARNTLDTDVLFSLYGRLAAEGKEAVRRRIGLPAGEPVLVFIGRLTREKGTDLLLDVFAGLRRERPAHLLVVGTGPEEQTMRERVAAEGLEGVRFLGALADFEASAPYLFASDVMLMPQGLGLAVNHAFAFGLPVVSCASVPGARLHGPEAAYVVSGTNGLLAAPSAEALLEAVRRVLAGQETFSRNAVDYARRHLSIDHMVDGLEQAIRYVEAPVVPSPRAGSGARPLEIGRL